MCTPPLDTSQIPSNGKPPSEKKHPAGKLLGSVIQPIPSSEPKGSRIQRVCLQILRLFSLKPTIGRVSAQQVKLKVLSDINSEKPITKERVDALVGLIKTLRKAERNDVVFVDVIKLATIFKHYESAPEEAKTKITERAGNSGSYHMRGPANEILGVFKPEKEEDHLSVRMIQGDGAVREHLASVLNEDKFYPIPSTFYIKLGDDIGSLQIFKKDCIPFAELYFAGNDSDDNPADKFPHNPIQRSILFDLRFGNADRHLGNLLVSGENLWMIDHGECMPVSESPFKLEQSTFLPQSEKEWDKDVIDHVKSWNTTTIHRHAAIMREHGVSEYAISHMLFSTMMLSKLIVPAEGKPKLTPGDVATLFIKNYDEISKYSQYKDVDASLAQMLGEINEHILQLVAKKKLEPK